MYFRKILVPVDFSAYSDRAVNYALFIAETFCAKITLYHAIVLFQEDVEEAEHIKAYETLIKNKEIRRAERLNIQCTNGKNRGVDIQSIIHRDISPADSILTHLVEQKYDLVIMGTHGRSGIKKWMFGSVAEKVVRHSPVAVLTVHRDWKKEAIKHILIPVDFSQFSKNAVSAGIALAKELKTKITFLHVVEQHTHPEFYSASFDSIFKINPQLKPHIKKNLMAFTKLTEKNAQFVVVEGTVQNQITNYAENHRIDLIVMATRGQGALDQLFLGSNAERVVRTASCPVLTVGRKSEGSKTGKSL